MEAAEAERFSMRDRFGAQSDYSKSRYGGADGCIESLDGCFSLGQVSGGPARHFDGLDIGYCRCDGCFVGGQDLCLLSAGEP